ncbi:MAG: hypothetical protein JST17_09140 [Bacteroidetes bacterium]|nr:hypothetical protein [Bacteroidota bacterium]
MKSIIISILFAMLTANLFAQKQSFDIVSYTAPTDWTLKQDNDYISYSRIDGASWAQIAIYQHRNCEGDIQTDFDKDWNELVAANKTISSPEKTEPKTAEGWTVMSGSGVWQYNGTNVASVLTVYSNNTICVAVLCNATAQPYLKNYKDLIGSLDLNAGNISENTNNINNANNSANNSGINGSWSYSISENGFTNAGNGYTTRQYSFASDGTYKYVCKVFSSVMYNVLLLQYESGTYKVNSNQLTIIPANGGNEEWSQNKVHPDHWGKLLKTSKRKLEKVTYTFTLQYFSGIGETDLMLQATNPTEREGAFSNLPDFPKGWAYKPCNAQNNPMIELPEREKN